MRLWICPYMLEELKLEADLTGNTLVTTMKIGYGVEEVVFRGRLDRRTVSVVCRQPAIYTRCQSQ